MSMIQIKCLISVPQQINQANSQKILITHGIKDFMVIEKSIFRVPRNFNKPHFLKNSEIYTSVLKSIILRHMVALPELIVKLFILLYKLYRKIEICV